MGRIDIGGVLEGSLESPEFKKRDECAVAKYFPAMKLLLAQFHTTIVLARSGCSVTLYTISLPESALLSFWRSPRLPVPLDNGNERLCDDITL